MDVHNWGAGNGKKIYSARLFARVFWMWNCDRRS